MLNPTWTLLAIATLCAAPVARADVLKAQAGQAAAVQADAAAPAAPGAQAGQGQGEDEADSDEEETAEGKAELEALRKAEVKAGFLAPEANGQEQVAIGLGEMHPLAQDLGAAMGPSVDGSPLADPAPVGSVFATLPELAGISEEELRAKYDIPIELNDAVVAYIRFFQTDVRAHFQRYLSRSTKFMPMMRQILEKEGLPLDLVYLSMIESGFNAYAYSWAKASGLWQFIVGTSRRYGLVSDFWVDERRDPEKATLAAAKYLRDLQKRFHGDWFLAWAGYNAGEGKIDRAIRAENTRDFWAMRKKGRTLRAETKHYVPKLIAAALIAKHPARFGFESIQYEQPWQIDEVFVAGAVDLGVIARAAGVSIEKIRELNPALRRSCTPPSGWKIKLPKGLGPVFAENLAKVPPEQRLSRLAEHKVEKGESLGKIARAYGVAEKAILKASGITSLRQVKVGRVLVIPLSQSHGGLVAGASLEDKSGKTRRAQGRIASVVTPQKLREPTKKSAAKAPRAKAGSHVVQSGDTLWSIAQKYKTTVEHLKSLNGLNGRKARALHLGQAIAVRDE